MGLNPTQYRRKKSVLVLHFFVFRIPRPWEHSSTTLHFDNPDPKSEPVVGWVVSFLYTYIRGPQSEGLRKPIRGGGWGLDAA